MADQETNRRMPDARHILEHALLAQFRGLADGLLSDLLLRGRNVTALEWWMQYLSRVDAPYRYLPDTKDVGFTTFRKQLVQDIVSRQLRRISPADLANTRIRVFGGKVYFWQQGRINRQLANLGSSLRLIVLRSDLSRANRIRSLMGKPYSAYADRRFILGRIGPISAFAGAALFDFEREFALSPYIPGEATGLTDQSSIVVRQVGLRIEAESSIANGASDPTDYQNHLNVSRRAVLAHEAMHIVQAGSQISQSQSGVSSWHAVVREDICRFTQVSRTMDEVRAAFDEAFNPSPPLGPLFSVPGPEHGYLLENEIQQMCDEKILLVESDAKIFCPLYVEDRRWAQ